MGSIREDEGDQLAGLDRELADRLSVSAVKWSRRSENQTLGIGDRVDRSVIQLANPRNRRPVIETHHKLGTKLHPSRPADGDPHEIGRVC
jgi:hypothetical protein